MKNEFSAPCPTQADISEFLFENIQSVDGCKNIWGQKAGQVYPWDWKEDKINITAPCPCLAPAPGWDLRAVNSSEFSLVNLVKYAQPCPWPYSKFWVKSLEMELWAVMNKGPL